MRSRDCISAALAALLVGLAGERAQAHHAFPVEQCGAAVTKTGTVTGVEWINPHTWAHILVSEPGKPDQAWMFEGSAPMTLARDGVDREMLKVGTAVTFRGYLAKDQSCSPSALDGRPTCKADGRAFALADGKWRFFGALGIGEPIDPAQPPGRYEGNQWFWDSGGSALWTGAEGPNCRDRKPAANNL